eukprot:1386496-Amphidinium_carterae.1
MEYPQTRQHPLYLNYQATYRRTTEDCRRVTKAEPYKFVVQCNHNNASGFETWRRLHVTYDQGEKAQHLAQLARVMKPTWNNTTQSPTDFIK